MLPPIGTSHFAKHNSPAIAELRHPAAELVPGICHGYRLGTLRDLVSCQDMGAPGRFEKFRIQTKIVRKRMVDLDQPRRLHRCRI